MAGAANMRQASSTVVTRLARPVRPPASTPVMLSTTVVVFVVPTIAPTDVADASARRARSRRVLNPPSPTVESSSLEKSSLLRPVPMKVPMVSNVSTSVKDMMVTSTMGMTFRSLKRDGRPSDVNMTPKVSGGT